MTQLIIPQWPQPEGVAACSSTRTGGVSLAPWHSLNLGAHCGDNPEHVEENRQRLFAAGGLPSKPVWLEQVHGDVVLRLDGEVRGYGYGVRLSDLYYDALIEKGDKDLVYAYRVLRVESVRRCAMDCKYVNLEEDLGIPGLRALKNAYQPEFLMDKYVVTQR